MDFSKRGRRVLMMHDVEKKLVGFVGPSTVRLLSANSVKSVLSPTLTWHQVYMDGW